eukprot:1159783-Pelagomonas_calceolata.AAC.9
MADGWKSREQYIRSYKPDHGGQTDRGTRSASVFASVQRSRALDLSGSVSANACKHLHTALVRQARISKAFKVTGISRNMRTLTVFHLQCLANVQSNLSKY